MRRGSEGAREVVRQGIGRESETGKLDLCGRQTNLLLAWLEKGLARKSFHDRGQPSRLAAGEKVMGKRVWNTWAQSTSPWST